jgi:hypothetical protein
MSVSGPRAGYGPRDRSSRSSGLPPASCSVPAWEPSALPRCPRRSPASIESGWKRGVSCLRCIRASMKSRTGGMASCSPLRGARMRSTAPWTFSGPWRRKHGRWRSACCASASASIRASHSQTVNTHARRSRRDQRTTLATTTSAPTTGRLHPDGYAINGQRFHDCTARPLRDGDLLTIGKHVTLRFSLPSGQAPREPDREIPGLSRQTFPGLSPHCQSHP